MTKCNYCGSNNQVKNHPIGSRFFEGCMTVPACSECRKNKSTQALIVWLHEEKRQNSVMWNRIVENNSRENSTISELVLVLEEIYS